MVMRTAVVLLLFASPLSATTLTYVNPGSEKNLTLRRSATATAAAVGSIPTLSTTMIALFAALRALVALRAARVLH